MKESKIYISENSYSSSYICHVIIGENIQQKLNEIKKKHGKIRLRGRHPYRKAVMKTCDVMPNCLGDVPVWLSRSVAVYKRN